MQRLTKVFLVSMFVLTLTVSVARAEDDPIVRMVYFYSEECAHCLTVIDEVLTPLQNEYGGQMQIRMVEISNSAGYEMLIRAEEKFAVRPEERGLPTLILADHVLVGEEAVREQLPCLLDACLEAGGAYWPDLPGLEDVAIDDQTEFSLEFSPSMGFEEAQPCGPEEITACESGESIWAAYFYQVGCQECSRVEADIQYIRSRYPQLIVEEFNVYDSVDVARCLAGRIGRVEDLHTPALFIGDDALMGQAEITPQNLETLVAEYADAGTEQIWKTCEREKIGLPGLMTVVLAGLMDGLNPCAFATLIFFVSYLAFLGRKGTDVLAVGGAFTLGVFLAYVLVGFGLWRLLSELPFLITMGRWMYGLTALLCGALAVLSFRDYLKARQGRVEDMALVMPEALRKGTHTIIRQASSLRVFVLVAFPIGMAISLLELACTGQIYLPTIIFVMSNPGLNAQATLLLVVYNLMFVLPLIVVFMLVYFGTTSMQLGLFLRRYVPAIKLGTAILLTALGAWLAVLALA